MPRFILVGLAFGALLLGASPTIASDASGANPQAAMREFLTACRARDYELAARYLDLSHLPPDRRVDEGPGIARRLKAVLDRSLWVELEDLSDAPEGRLDDGLPKDRERVGTIPRAQGAPIALDLELRGGAVGQPAWRISDSTLSAVPALSEGLRLAGMEDRLPPIWVETRFLEIELWQWVALPVLIGLAALLAWIASFVLRRSLGRLARRTKWTFDDRLVAVSIAPVRLLVGVFSLALGQRLLALALPAERAIETLAGVLAVLAFTWLLLRWVDIAAELVRDRMQAQGRPGAVGLVPLGRRSVKLFLGALAIIAALQNLGMNVTGILAGLGVGGLAVALAAQKTIENFFGGATLVADQPVRVGDFCRFGDRVGTVEAVGLRSTRIRTLDRTVVTVPNAEFAVLPLENYTQRDRIWFQTVLGLRYETTADQLRHLLVGLRKLLRADPRVDPVPARVRFVGFGAYSLDVEIFAYIRTRDFDEFLAIREDLLLQIMDCVAASGTGFAFPSQTLYTAKDSGLDPERSRAAIEEARRWRERSQAPPG